MLTAFKFENFKSYRWAELPLAPLTVLIGANASGKSNAIEALRLLSWLAQGQRLGSIQYAVQESERVVRGRASDLGYCGERSFTLQCSLEELAIDMPEHFEASLWNRLSVSLALRDDELHISHEQIAGSGQKVQLYWIDEPSTGMSTDVRVRYNNFARGGVKPSIVCSDQLAIFMQLESAARFGEGHTKAQKLIPEVCGSYRKLLGSMLFLDPVPPRMRGYAFMGERRLAGDGANLSGVLHHLWTGKDKEVNRRDLLRFVQSLPEQEIGDIGFLETPRNEVMVQLAETFGGERRLYDATLLSDGTLRVLAIAAAMLSAPERSLVVIEEIDNGVHPSRAEHLLATIRAIAERRQLRILLSTHNPALLDALPLPAVPDVVFCYRDPAEGSSRLVRLQDLADYPELMAQGTLGHLVTTGLLDRFVKHHPGPEARRWLEGRRQASGGH